jgi:hypothetical protein
MSTENKNSEIIYAWNCNAVMPEPPYEAPVMYKQNQKDLYNI